MEGAGIIDASMDGVLRVRFAPSRPIELTDFVKSCMALAGEYGDFAAARGAPDGRLYVKEVRKGSIEIDLVAVAAVAAAVQQTLRIAGEVNVLADFLSHLKGVRDWILGGAATAAGNRFGQKTLQRVSDFLEPVAKDGASSVTVQVLNIHGDMNAPLSFCSQDANGAQNIVRRLGREGQGQNVTSREQTILRWYQSRNSTDGRGGDMAIIESISPNPVRTVFKNRDMKALLLSLRENIFHALWLVDVEVETVGGVPRLYRIGRIERLDGAAEDAGTNEEEDA